MARITKLVRLTTLYREWEMYTAGTLLILVYMPLAWFSYGFSDDYGFLYDALTGTNKILEGVISSGRPVMAVLSRLSWGLLGSIDQMRYLRLIAIFGIGLLGVVLYGIIRQHQENRITALLQATFLCLTPAFQVYAGFTVCFLFPYAIILASVSGYLTGHIHNKLFSYLIPMILLAIAFVVYQPTAMYFWVIASLMLLVDYQDNPSMSLRRLFRKVIKFCVVWAIPALVSFLIIKIGSHYFPADDRSDLIPLDQVVIKLFWFIKEPLSRSLNIFTIGNSAPFSILVFLFLIIGMLVVLHGKLAKRITLILVFLAILFISYLPNLIIAEYWPTYRSTVALSGMIVLLLLFVIEGLFSKAGPNVLNSILLAAFLFCSFNTSSQMINSIAVPQVIELSYLKNQLNTNDLKNISEIRIIQADSDALIPTVIDEFGRPSTNTDWAPEPMIRLVLMEKQPQYADIPIAVFPPQTKPDFEDTQILWIDMQKISTFK